MDRRVVLVALWAVFAMASVGVGFAAAGLVGHPFTDGSSTVAVEGGAASSSPASSTPAGSPSSTTTGTKGPKGTKGPTGTRTGSPSATTEPTPVVRGFTTRGGYVSASCRGGLVAVSASPAVGWRLDSVSRGRVMTADVEFRSGDLGVEVTATCVGGLPRFSLDERGGGGGSGHGGDDSGGSGDGGSDGSSGSGSGGGDG